MAGQALVSPSHVSATSQLPLAERQVVPSVFFRSGGHAPPVTGQNSAVSHGPAAGRQIDVCPGTQIARLYLDKVRRQMERQGKTVEITEAAVNKLTESGFNTAYGARFLKRHIDEKVKLPITGMWKTSSQFSVDVENGEVVVKPEGGSNPGLN